jgi:hypothetical protein
MGWLGGRCGQRVSGRPVGVAGAQVVTPGAVRCSAWLGVSGLIGVDARLCAGDDCLDAGAMPL